MAIEPHDDTLPLVFGKAFLVAVEHHDALSATVFAKAFLTVLPHEYMQACEVLN